MQPVVIQDTISIAANSVNENLIASNNSLKALQRLPFPSKLTLAGVQSANGLLCDFNIGTENVVASSSFITGTGAPEIPFDICNGDCYGQEGDLLILRAANPTGAAISLRYLIIAEPMAAPGELVELPPNTRVMQQGPTSIANAVVDQQLLSGLRYERAPVDCIMSLFMTSSAAGLTRQVFVDMDRVAPSSTISLANSIPQDPLDMTVSGIEVPKDSEIQLPVTNNSGGALNVFWKQVLKDVYRR